MKRAIIVEDVQEHFEHLTAVLRKCIVDIEIVGHEKNVEKAYVAIVAKKPELVFLDIDLQGYETGFDLLKKFPVLEFEVIFTTQYFTPTFVQNAFNACAINYLVKPVTHDAVERALINAPSQKINNEVLKSNIQSDSTSEKSVLIKTVADGKIKIPVDKIMYCEANVDSSIIYLVDPIWNKSTFRTTDSLKILEKKLYQFQIYRVHASFLVNARIVQKFDKGTLYCKHELIFKVPFQRRAKVEEWLNEKNSL